jgi:ParB family transcriptional regulator, chromosome partitioning protein
MANATAAEKRDDKDDKIDDKRDKNMVGKVSEKLAEKRRALGRGLESLLPGPRAVAAPAPTLPQNARKDGAPDGESSQFSVPGSQQSGSQQVSVQQSSVQQPGSFASGSAPTSRTLDSLQASAVERTLDGDVLLLELDQIEQNPYQTRTEFEEKGLSDLAGSIQAQGVLQPIVVRPSVKPSVSPSASPSVGPQDHADGRERFILILGERRFRASKMAGKTTIPAIVKRVSEQQAAEMTLVENLQRQDLDCLDQAQAFAKLSTQFGLTQDVIGKRVGVSREQVSNYLRLLKLPQEVQAALRNKELSYSHARLLLSLSDESQIIKVARVVIAKKMSVALLEEMVMDSHIPKGEPAGPKEGGARWVDPNVRAAQRSLEVVLGMRVRIRDRKGKGKITIEYGTLEDFDRVVGMLRGK